MKPIPRGCVKPFIDKAAVGEACCFGDDVQLGLELGVPILPKAITNGWITGSLFQE